MKILIILLDRSDWDVNKSPQKFDKTFILSASKKIIQSNKLPLIKLLM